MRYYKYIEEQYNPARGCQTIRIGTFNDYRKYEGNDFIQDKNEGIWRYSFSPSEEISIPRNIFDKWFSRLISIKDNLENIKLKGFSTEANVDNLLVEAGIHELNINTFNSHVNLQKNDRIDFCITAPNTFMFCIGNKLYETDSSEHKDYYSLDKRVLESLIQEIRKELLKKVRYNFDKGYFITDIPNFCPAKIRCVPRIIDCFYYKYTNDFESDWGFAQKIFNDAQSIFYLKDEKYKYQNETRILFPILYPIDGVDIILEIPIEHILIPFPQGLLEFIEPKKEIILSPA